MYIDNKIVSHIKIWEKYIKRVAHQGQMYVYFTGQDGYEYDKKGTKLRSSFKPSENKVSNL